jgi:hypothetical protein
MPRTDILCSIHTSKVNDNKEEKCKAHAYVGTYRRRQERKFLSTTKTTGRMTTSTYAVHDFPAGGTPVSGPEGSTMSTFSHVRKGFSKRYLNETHLHPHSRTSNDEDASK